MKNAAAFRIAQMHDCYLNTTGDFRTMINGFVYSTEYQSRFGAP